MTSSVQKLQSLGQLIWYDNVRRGLLRSGGLNRLTDLGVSGLTSNPTIFEKAIAGSNDYDEALLSSAPSGKDAAAVFEDLAVEDIREAADILRPIFDRAGGGDGHASLEVSPHLAHNTEGTVAEARRLFARLDRPNVLVKVPATPEGIPAIRTLIGEGISVNVTLIFSLETYARVREAYLSGLEDLVRNGGNPSRVASVASFFVSRVDTAVDAALEKGIREGHEEWQDLLGRAAIANAKVAYRAFKDGFADGRFAALRRKGARVQRPLWASTGTKNPSYSDILYVESLIGIDTVDTVPEATLTAYLDHGDPQLTLEQDVEGAVETLRRLDDTGISLEQVTDRLLADGVDSFAQSYDKLLSNIAEKTAGLVKQDVGRGRASLGAYEQDVIATLADLDSRAVVERMWRRDHTVWKPDPDEVANRLGWLSVSDGMCERADELDEFAREVRDAGFRKVVLLGMGGSSLGPEVLRQTFGSAVGYPELIVLDSTVPSWIRAVTNAIDPATTLFLVSSKSGGTIEPNTLYAHFRGLADQAVGPASAGAHFVAITDPGTSLHALAREGGFRRVFLNPDDIGGRYSVLSYFGLVPAALIGIDVSALLDRADCMREGSASCVPARDNPGAWLGATIARLSLGGRDKLTLVTSPSIASFGLWAEQLIAESTGKEGKGIVPIAGEPLVSPDHYGSDRLFVYLRVDGDSNADIDAAIELLDSAGQPVVRLNLRDRYDLGAEFYRWEFATAVAGAVLEINPFDQPNVQQAKDLTDDLLRDYVSSGQMPDVETGTSLSDFLRLRGGGDYLAIIAFLRETPAANEALSRLRESIIVRHGIATTLGYGPRFLHSTGQLHKGGADSGMFLQIVASSADELPIPGRPYSFGLLAEAQALGDLRALAALGRRAARVRLGDDDAAALQALVDEVARPDEVAGRAG